MENQDSQGTWENWQIWTLVLLGINAILGIMMLEWAWKKTQNFRNPIKELDDLFPAYRRVDATKWRKIDFYFGAMTIMIPRMIFNFLAVAFLTVMVTIVLCG